jgi:hypothetical protein
MKSTIAVLILSAFARLFGQGADAPAPPEKKQDAGALKLVERFDSLVYAPRAAGLKDVEFTTRLPNGLDLVIRWKAPDAVASDLRVPADTPEKNVEPLKLIVPVYRAEAARHAPSFAKIIAGEVLLEQHKDDDLTLVSPNVVKIVARSDSSKAIFKEQTLTFDEAGLVKQAVVTAPTGLVSTLEPTFAPWNGRHVYQTLKTTMGTDEQKVTFEYEHVEPFMLVKKLTTEAKVRGKVTKGSLEFRDFKPNAGIQDVSFGEPKGQ